MNRLYINSWTNLGVARSRYGILCRDDGFIYDDGVVARLASDRFHVTTTTGGAPRVLAMMEDYRQTEWPDLKVWLTSTTEQWAVIAVQGPRSRSVLESLVEGIDLGAAALPHMGVGRGRICGIPMMLFRVSFTGELGFEVNVPADFGAAVWEAVHAAGQKARHGGVWNRDDARAARREGLHHRRPGHRRHRDARRCGAHLGGGKTQGGFRRQAVPGARIDEGSRPQAARRAAHARRRGRPRGGRAGCRQGAPIPADGPHRACDVCLPQQRSGYPIALALVAGGRSRMGQTLYVPMPGGDIEVEVTSPVFYDPTGARING